ncbi:hypothetical protein Taro_012023 [Colocasia esculenta]|uniref:Uncharacterized protein n=1 Tax=Colocasia esculenta TaxID=4460 RepID=A0A843UHV4_COLES|nr:hypothetical protein [Colocasia esculenta]
MNPPKDRRPVLRALLRRGEGPLSPTREVLDNRGKYPTRSLKGLVKIHNPNLLITLEGTDPT